MRLSLCPEIRNNKPTKITCLTFKRMSLISSQIWLWFSNQFATLHKSWNILVIYSLWSISLHSKLLPPQNFEKRPSKLILPSEPSSFKRFFLHSNNFKQTPTFTQALCTYHNAVRKFWNFMTICSESSLSQTSTVCSNLFSFKRDRWFCGTDSKCWRIWFSLGSIVSSSSRITWPYVWCFS